MTIQLPPRSFAVPRTRALAFVLSLSGTALIVCSVWRQILGLLSGVARRPCYGFQLFLCLRMGAISSSHIPAPHRKLEILDLFHNRLVHVLSFLPRGLQHLTLHHNRIKRIPGYIVHTHEARLADSAPVPQQPV